MREISLHILDIIENAIRAKASVVSVGIDADAERDLLTIRIEDNGSGLNIAPEEAVDPFFTTKAGKKTGLGLSLFRAAAAQAGGGLAVAKSSLGGVAVTVTMGLNHIDRQPLGDVAATLSSVVAMNPGIDLWCRFSSGDRKVEVRTSDVAAQAGVRAGNRLALARKLADKIREGQRTIGARG